MPRAAETKLGRRQLNRGPQGGPQTAGPWRREPGVSPRVFRLKLRLSLK